MGWHALGDQCLSPGNSALSPALGPQGPPALRQIVNSLLHKA
jgi:hypothetical protein